MAYGDGNIPPTLTTWERGGRVTSLTEGETPAYSNDGRYITFVHADVRGGYDLHYLEIEGDGKSVPFIVSPAAEYHPRLSPDGRWLAYSSDVNGRAEIYVRSFPDPGPPLQVSVDGGGHPRWDSDGRRIYYAWGGRLSEARLRVGEELELAETKVLFDLGAEGIETQYAGWDMTSDGSRFLMVQTTREFTSQKLRVVQNWFSEFAQ